MAKKSPLNHNHTRADIYFGSSFPPNDRFPYTPFNAICATAQLNPNKFGK
eukprot:CAMPEP_0196176378 /NCGR_PEP_ID=MMETSP0911-20130528/8668_1 /TAXON_ID=49265 /ORGANISM="Thalassiosira rotula, Strain GSO102" /LENGTH=49 /DNA_ID=CAMNT_0041444101 /DNA_START=561 /DNA_END=710 /DNA_ORIENTATION=-